MNPQHIELLRRALPLISSETLATAVADVLMTGARPECQDTNRVLMPHAAELFERFVVHLIDPVEFVGPDDTQGYDWAAEGLEKFMPKTNDEPRTP